jgi:hypothetical protein
VQVFADNASQLLRVLSRENEEQKAHSPEQMAQYRERLLERLRPVMEQHQDKGQAQDLGIAI